jgi:hypothetical protein
VDLRVRNAVAILASASRDRELSFELSNSPAWRG